MSHRLLSVIDLTIDFATLGEYGLEPQTADGPCRERSGHRPDWEALRRPAAARAARGGCDSRSRRRIAA